MITHFIRVPHTGMYIYKSILLNLGSLKYQFKSQKVKARIKLKKKLVERRCFDWLTTLLTTFKVVQ